jgi:hypothetical protein
MLTALRSTIESDTVDPAVIPGSLAAPHRGDGSPPGSDRNHEDGRRDLAELDAMEGIHAEARYARITSLGDIPLAVVVPGVPPPQSDEKDVIGTCSFPARGSALTEKGTR